MQSRLFFFSPTQRRASPPPLKIKELVETKGASFEITGAVVYFAPPPSKRKKQQNVESNVGVRLDLERDSSWVDTVTFTHTAC